ncbi:MAG: LPS-assembly protein LptD [Bacteroidales bacterium]|nr:LPS-assembly protein LptD [Bacteroidales bacterium]
MLITVLELHAQEYVPEIDSSEADYYEILTDTMGNGNIALDSIAFIDTTLHDTINIHGPRKKEDAVDAKVDYKSADTLIIDLTNKTIYLHKDAQVIYKDIQLDAAYIEFDMANNEVYAEGKLDTVGVPYGKPAFKDGGQSFDAENLRYNFKTKKGIIKHAISPQEGGYLHAGVTKKQADGTIHVKDGKYTTCDLEHPHFYIAMTKAKVIPDDKIVSGPAYLVVADVPLYFLGIPFGFFPNTKKSKAGILIPSYGEEKVRGFYLRHGGWYMPINDYMDFQITFDVYSMGSWGARSQTRYVKRYKFSGNFEGNFNKNVYGDKGLPDYYEKKDYRVTWVHRQDQKANPSSNFNANVNVSSSSYDRNNSYSTQDYLTNTKNSSISYSKNWLGTPFFLDVNANYTQNSTTEQVDMILPSASFRMNRIYPFKSKKSVGKPKWYEQLQLSYSSNFENRISTYDSIVFTDAMFDDMKYGYSHGVPFSTNFKFLKFCNLSPSLSYKGVIYGSRTLKYYDADYVDPEDNTRGRVVDTIIPGLNYAHAVIPSISLSVDPTVYGMYQPINPNSKLIAVRHVMKPSARFSFTPDINKMGLIPKSLYYDSLVYDDVQTNRHIAREYSIYEGYIYGTPLAPGRSGSVSFSLRNNFEMKVRTPKDTAQDEKKVKLLDVLDFTMSYNPFANKKETTQWSDINATASNSYFNNKLNVRLRGNFNHYQYYRVPDSKSFKILTPYPFRTLRLTSASLTLGTSFKSKQKKSTPDSNKPAGEEGVEPIDEGITEENVYNDYVDFNIPWDFRIDYSYNYSKPYDVTTEKITQSLTFSGNLSLTPKWKIGFRSGYDIVAKDFTYTSFNIFRDLHCWEMRFSVVPFGYRQNYNFMINIKTAILRDLKYEKKQSWYDRAE